MSAIRKRNILLCWMLLGLAACNSAYPPRDTSTLDKINTQLGQAATPAAPKAEAPLPEAVDSMLLPPVRMSKPMASIKQLEQRFDLVIRDTPIEQVLMGLVVDTPYSIMLKPKTAVPVQAGGPAAAEPSDRITLNLKDVTVFKALDVIREVYGYDYTVDGNIIYVQPPELQTRLYQVNYIIGQRRGVSDIQVIGGTSGGTSGAATGSATGATSGGGSGYSSIQASALSTVAKSDVWGEIEDAVRTTLGCKIPASKETTSISSSGNTRANTLYIGEASMSERSRGMDGCTSGRAMTINQMSGAILVRGMPNEHRMIGKMLRSMQLSIARQVIIEAKIIDVVLNPISQQGINWAAFGNNQHQFSVGANTALANARNPAGGIFPGASLGNLLGGNGIGAIEPGLGIAVQYRNFAAMINFLETQGTVHVLSSPRIATLNSQKAIIKVGSEEPFVTGITAGTTTQGAGPAITSASTLTYQPFFSGISLDVTPQIDDQDNITLHVHSMVNSVVEKQKISRPDVGAAMAPFAVNTINETDNVIKTRDGQVVVIGGLMTERNQDYRAKVPGAGDVPGVGALFSNGVQSSIKRELVILLKTTVVKDDSDWNNDIAAAQGRVEALSARMRDNRNANNAQLIEGQ